MSFPRYPRYKDSGVEWLGQVPEHWDALPLRQAACEGPGGFVDGDWIETPFITDDGVRLIQTGNIGLGSYKEQGGRFVSEQTFRDLRCTEVLPGNVLICRLADPVGRACLAPKLESKMITSVDVCILKPKSNIIPEFLVYLCSSAEYLGCMESQCRGGTRDRVSRRFLGALRIVLPPTSEQRRIRDFLDRETTKIDALVAEQQRLIELLKEKRQAVISHAVTKGLNPDAPMKDSGVEWLGQVPAHWTCTTLRRIAARVVVGIAEAATHAYIEGGVPILRSTNIRAGRIVGDVLSISPDFAAERGTKLINAGDLVTVRTGNAGVTAVVPPHLDGCQCFTMLITTLERDHSADYYCLWANSEASQHYFGLEGWGTAQVNISVPILKELPVPVPPPDEQRQIVEVVGRAISECDALVTEAQNAVDLLQERRTALISAAVTGQIDVRGADTMDVE